MSSRKKSRKKVKFKKIILKVSLNQKDLLDRCVRLNNTSINKLIRSSVSKYIQENKSKLKKENEEIENQLMLFETRGGAGKQLTIDD